MSKTKFFVLVFKTRQDRVDGNYEYEFDCKTLNKAHDAANSEVDEGNYAASIYERSGTTAPSIRISTHFQPMQAV